MFRTMMEKAVKENCFQAKADFLPFPKHAQREPWEALSDEAKAYFEKSSEAYRSKVFPILPARAYMRFLKDGNRSEFEEMYFERRRALYILVIDECIRNQGENISAVIDLIWAMCEESSWVIHAHNRIRSRSYTESILPEIDEDIFIDLFSAETGSLLAWCVYLMEDILNAESPVIVRRIRYELKKRLLVPYLTYSDYGYMGLSHPHPVNNWNPWINENILSVTLLTEENPETRNALLLKIGKSVQRFIDFYAPDGGCDEGPAYFNVAGGSYLDCLDLVYRATDGKASLYHEPLTKNMAAYIMNAHIAQKYYINFADAVCRLTPDGMLLLRAAERMNLPELRDFAVSLLRDGDSEPYYAAGTSVIHRRIANLLEFKPDMLTSAARPYPLSHAFNGIQVALARQDTSGHGLFFAAKGGHNMESHNHNDVGNYIVYLDGEPVLCDIGVETYSRKTFSGERYTIFTMQSGYHNTAVINGFDQLPGYEYKAENFSFTDDGIRAVYSASIEKAYPADAGAVSYKRRIILDRNSGDVSITDVFTLSKLTSGITLPLITRYEPEPASGKIILSLPGGKAAVEFDEQRFSVETENIKITDKKLLNAWQTDSLYRVLLLTRVPEAEGEFTIRIKALK